MKFEWDPEKNRKNKVKHGIDFESAKAIWDDPFHVVYPDRFEDGEQRWHAVGVLGSMILLMVIHTYRNRNNEEIVRIIGARKATRQERAQYEQ
jgi:uncharacterized protein